VILLDASVLIEYLRRRDPALGRALSTLDLGLCGITRAEILHGARDKTDRLKLITLLDQFHFLPIPESLWNLLGDHLHQLRTHGIIVPFTDAALATLAIHLDIELWGFDAHFPLIASVLPLKLYRSFP
jgi:predicted nucleic acid-binding protein